MGVMGACGGKDNKDEEKKKTKSLNNDPDRQAKAAEAAAEEAAEKKQRDQKKAKEHAKKNKDAEAADKLKKEKESQESITGLQNAFAKPGEPAANESSHVECTAPLPGTVPEVAASDFKPVEPVEEPAAASQSQEEPPLLGFPAPLPGSGVASTSSTEPTEAGLPG